MRESSDSTSLAPSWLIAGTLLTAAILPAHFQGLPVSLTTLQNHDSAEVCSPYFGWHSPLPASMNRAQKLRLLQGRYRFVPTSSEKFARRKRQEIVAEEEV